MERQILPVGFLARSEECPYGPAVRFRFAAVLLGVSLALAPTAVVAKGKVIRTHEKIPKRSGRPDVRLNRLDLPADTPNLKHFRSFLTKRLAKETRRAIWGAGRDNVIEYRFSVTELSIIHEEGVVRVKCTAVGKLPGGQAAKSHLTFGGEPAKQNKVVERVLEIVAHGVIVRLSELERIRRGDLERERVRAPTSG
jgi:hypothetical protein